MDNSMIWLHWLRSAWIKDKPSSNAEQESSWKVWCHFLLLHYGASCGGSAKNDRIHKKGVLQIFGYPGCAHNSHLAHGDRGTSIHHIQKKQHDSIDLWCVVFYMYGHAKANCMQPFEYHICRCWWPMKTTISLGNYSWEFIIWKRIGHCIMV